MTQAHDAQGTSRLHRLFAIIYLASLNTALHGLSRLPYRVRRYGLQSTFVCLKPVLTGRITDAMSRGFATVLASSMRDARRFTYHKLRHDMTFVIEWMALGRRSVAGLVADARHLSSDAGEDLQWLAAQPGGIIGTMHFGPYALGLVWLIHTYFQGRKIIIFKNDDSDEESRAIARLGELGASVEFVAPDAVLEFHRLVKEIRSGAIVIIMVDMPPGVGPSDDMDLLGHRLTIATGAADLAALSRVPLMLLRIRAGKKGDRVEIGDIFDVARHDAGSRARAVSRIVRFVTDTLQRYPEQWHMWERFGDYLPRRTETTS